MKAIIFFLSLLCCNCKPNKNENLSNTVETTIYTENRIFLSDKINDTLLLFVTSIDNNIPNPYNAPTMYIIICEKNKNDTTLRFYAYPGLIKEVDIDTHNNNIKKEISFKVIGGKQIKSKPIIIYSDGFENLKGLIYEDSISIGFVNDNDFFYKYNGDMYDWSYYPVTEWLYKLVNSDSLILLYKKKGKNEK
jgi:hypothetical protein